MNPAAPVMSTLVVAVGIVDEGIEDVATEFWWRKQSKRSINRENEQAKIEDIFVISRKSVGTYSNSLPV